ncbi:SUKH-4 family immunity protein [Streptomyces sp. NPDC005402]|uniref:SUKH-4 family immunity protein n=1 Tax=Streptomyces sp. NPDC005402 TaxID=3155338 RepID=UPI0033A83AD0
MVTFAQAQERAEEWINGDVPSYQHREVRVREFDLGFVVWAEDRAEGPRSDGGAQRLVIARDSGEATLWPSLPVGEVIRRYEEEYGGEDAGGSSVAPAASRVDLNQTSFLLSPPEWLQDAADKLGIGGAADGDGPSGAGDGSSGSGAVRSDDGRSGSGSGAGPGSGAVAGVPAGARPWTGTDTNGGEDLSVALPDTVFSAPVSDGSGGTEEGAGASSASEVSEFSEVGDVSEIVEVSEVSEISDSRTARISGGGRSSSSGAQGGGGTSGATASGDPGAGAVPSSVPGASSYGYPQGAGDGPEAGVPGAPGAPRPAPSAGDIADVATSKLAPPSRAAGGPTPPPPPGAPGVPGAQPGGVTPPPAPGAQGAGYVPTQFVSAPGVEGPSGSGSPQPPGPPSAPAAPTPPPPGGPGFPGAPGAAGAPQPSGIQDASPFPSTAGAPGGSGASGFSGAPGAAGASQSPGGPGAPQFASVPGAPGGYGFPGAPGAPGGSGAPQPHGVPATPGAAGAPQSPGAQGAPQFPNAPGGYGFPGAPGGPGAPQSGAPGARQGVGAPGVPQPPGPPGVPLTGSGAVHHAETVLSSPPVGGPGMSPPPQAPASPGAPSSPSTPGHPGVPGSADVPGVPSAPGFPGAPGAAPGSPQPMPPGTMPPPPPGAVPSPGPVPPAGQPMPGQPAPGQPAPGQPAPGHPVPGQPPAYGYPQQSQPTVGPGYQAVLRYRAQDGSEQQLIRRSAPGMPHPEWQIFHELRGMNVPPDQVLELHTELESCELPGAYCARMIREQWPQARIASIAPYGTDHASRQQGMQQLLAHQGELHQVADGPARPAPVRAPLPPVQAVPPVPPEGVAQELAGAFGPGIFRFEQVAVDRQGVPPVVAHSLVVAGLPLDMGPFFWAQAQPGRPVPTLAELAAERGVQPASDAGSYLVMGSDFGKAICVQYGTANIVAVPVEAGPGGAPVPPQFVNTGLPEFQRCLALLGRMWRLRFGLNQEQAGRWTVDFQAQLAALDPAALGSPESWWSVLLEQMWDGLL